MLYSLLLLTALLLKESSAAGSTQTRIITDTFTTGIAALNNLVVIGNADGGTSAGKGSLSFVVFDYAINADNTVTAGSEGDFNQAASGTTEATYWYALPYPTHLAGDTFMGLGYDVAIADSNTVFASQTSVSEQTGRVVVLEGNVTTFTETQLLIPYDGKHRLDSEAAFGESIAAKHDALAVGCQNCNSSAPVFSGAVYIYKPNKEGRWSETQTLTAEGVLFLGERVAMHEKVLVAAGDTGTGVAYVAPARKLGISTKNHQYADVANTVVVFEEGHHGVFEQRQVIATKSGSFHEHITGLTVFDETIAITTMGSDLPSTSPSASRDKVYIYYPMNKRYGLEPKGKPSPQQWTNIQILTTSGASQFHLLNGQPFTSISYNSLKFLTAYDATNIGLASSTRGCLSCKFVDPTVVAGAGVIADANVALTADSTAFYGLGISTVDLVETPMANTNFDNCLTIQLLDQFSDGWGTASLVVTSPSGRRDIFTSQCTSANPNSFKFCPQSQESGKFHLHVENGEETPYGWEILFKVAAGSSWYVGDRHTHMDFLFDTKYNDFVVGATKGTLPLIDTCKVCDPNKPAGKHRSLSNLRALHHKGTTHSPTMSAAPTILATGYTGKVWNQFTFVTSSQWFTSDYLGTKFFISDKDGKHLFQSGTQCVAAAGESCWVDLPDGDYTLRVGGVTTNAAFTYAFCESSNPIVAHTELKFTILDQQCYAGMVVSVDNLCLNTYKSDWFLDVDILLSGAVETLSASEESTLNVALSETMVSVLGSVPSATVVKNQALTSSGLKLTMAIQFSAIPDSTALDNFAKDSSSAGSLLKYELIGSQALSANFLKGEVSGVTILSASTDAKARDFAKIDESSFQTVTDHVWLSGSAEAPSNNFNKYAEYVAEGAYALVAVAAVLAVSLYAKRALAKTTVVEEEIKA